MHTRRTCLAILLIAALMIAGGCSDDDNPVIVLPAAPPGAASADLVAAGYLDAFANMTTARLETILQPDFQMLLQPRTSLLFPDVGTSFDRADQMRVASRMFSGVPLTTPNGELLPHLSAIQFERFVQQGEWTEVPSGEDFSGSQAGLFESLIFLQRPGFATMRVEGLMQLFVAEADTVISGTNHTYWQLIGLRDLTGNFRKESETQSWGSIQALFWTPAEDG